MVSDEVRAAFKLLRDEGFLVVKIPECQEGDRDHGSHKLITRTARCPGGGTIPHGYHSSGLGLFGMWVNCQCGDSFSDYRVEERSEWEKHKIQFPEFF